MKMRPVLIKFGVAAVSMVAVLATAGATQATMDDLGQFTSPGTVSGMVSYKPDEVLTFKFDIHGPLDFVFTATGSGGTFPMPYTIVQSGVNGKEKIVFDEPYKGTIDYMLTTSLSAVSEPATWAFMILGFGLVGGVARRRARVMQPA